MPASARQTNPTKTHSRKRKRYVPHACNRCRAAKVRCDGGLPCGYCVGRDRYTCYYSTPPPPSFQNEPAHTTVTAKDNADDFQSSISTLLEQQSTKLDLLMERVVALDKTPLSLKPRPETREVISTPPEQPLPIFQSSTSSLFCMGIIDTNLRKLDHHYTTPLPSNVRNSLRSRTTFSIVHGEIIDEVSNEDAGGELEDGLIVSLPRAAGIESRPMQTQPLDRSDLVSLVHGYQNLAGILYPILDITSLLQQARDIQATRPTERLRQKSGVDSSMHQVESNDVAILNMVAAIALLAEDEAHYERALGLYQSILPDVEAMVWGTKVDLKGLVLLTLVSLFHVHQGKWRLAWRFVGNVTRVILELALNRQIVLERSFPNIVERTQAINAIWTIFVLNRVLSYSLGLAVAMQDLHLDLTFPGPVGAPYLEAMIEYARIACPAIDALMDNKNSDHSRSSNRQEIFAFFQYRLDEWAKRITTDFQFWSNDYQTNIWNEELRTVLYLRENHLRTVVARTFICDNRCTTAPMDIWALSVDAAVDSIQRLSRLDSSTKKYRFHQSQYNYFLIAALGILLLAITRDSSDLSSSSSREQRIPMGPTTIFKARQNSMIALQIIYSSAKSSPHSRCLWERVRGIASRLSLLDHLVPQTEASGLENEAWAKQVPSAGNVSMESERTAEPYAFEGMDMIPLGLQDMAMSLLSKTPSPPGLDVTQDFGVLLDSTFFANNF